MRQLALENRVIKTYPLTRAQPLGLALSLKKLILSLFLLPKRLDGLASCLKYLPLQEKYSKEKLCVRERNYCGGAALQLTRV
jgi:hypothetical protein